MRDVVQLKEAVNYSEDRINKDSVTLENFVTTDNLLQNKLGLTTAVNLPPQEGSLPSFNSDNILVANIRPYLKKIWFSNRNGGCSADVLVFKVKNEYDPKFVYYGMYRDDFFNHMMRGAKGTKMPRGDKNQIMEFTLPNFKKSIQKKIAAVLSALDAKIELNNRINIELEARAKTLYDYWFVQFDFPISKEQAKAMGKPELTGKPYKYSGGRMVYDDTLKMEIPEGWEGGTASDLFIFNPFLSLSKGSVCPYIDMNALPVAGFMTKSVQPKEFNGGSKFQNGDLVIARITPCLENGKTGLITLLDSNKIGFGSTEFIVIRGKNFSLSSFAACLSRSNKFRKFAISNMTGTSGRKRIESKILETFSMVIPLDSILKQFEDCTNSYFRISTTNTKQNQQLTQLRDWLLPMLMNGQVTVK